MHYVELDQFIGPRYLVTVHGPLNPAVDPTAAAAAEVQAVLHRLDNGRLRVFFTALPACRPSSPTTPAR